MDIQATYPAMVSNREVALKYSEIAETIFANTESDSVILCQYFDKMLFPKRKVGIISSLQQDPKLLANITATLKQNNVPVYILVDGPISLQQFDGELSKRDYFLRLVDPASKLYRVQEGVD
ncbi:MAG: hypothetical protein QME54_00735 [Actinomycetota bacterium]|nr:hypothetical protein [Actinomycetota bacterium]